MNEQTVVLTAERLECSEWGCLKFCGTKSLVLLLFYMDFLLFLLFLISGLNVWWSLGLIFFNSTILFQILLHTIPQLGGFLLPFLVSCTHANMLLCFLFLLPETLFDCTYIEVVISFSLTLGTDFVATIIDWFPSLLPISSRLSSWVYSLECSVSSLSSSLLAQQPTIHLSQTLPF